MVQTNQYLALGAQLLHGSLFYQVGSPTKKGLTAARFLPGNNNLVVTGGLAGHVQIINIRFLEPHLSFFSFLEKHYLNIVDHPMIL